jgi:hypothetical protein
MLSFARAMHTRPCWRGSAGRTRAFTSSARQFSTRHPIDPMGSGSSTLSMSTSAASSTRSGPRDKPAPRPRIRGGDSHQQRTSRQPPSATRPPLPDQSLPEQPDRQRPCQSSGAPRPSPPYGDPRRRLLQPLQRACHHRLHVHYRDRSLLVPDGRGSQKKAAGLAFLLPRSGPLGRDKLWTWPARQTSPGPAAICGD